MSFVGDHKMTDLELLELLLRRVMDRYYSIPTPSKLFEAIIDEMAATNTTRKLESERRA